MSDATRNETIKKLIVERTRAKTVCRKIARETLISEGVYTKKGTIRANYGGGAKKSTNAA